MERGDGTLKRQAGIEIAGGLLASPMSSIEGEVSGKLLAAAGAVNAGAGKNSRKRAREIEGKENEDVREGEGGVKRVLRGDGLADEEVVR